MSQIDEKTNVRLFAVIAAMPFILGGMLWLTSIDNKASAGVEAKDQLKGVTEMLVDVRERLIRIEVQIKLIQNKGEK